ncbi:helix-turn-helix domain-containing protein [Streptomyces sp. NPDC090106]|uniref:helix-turn-helix domain-containing protein n=1 Tax=Streptomyces sp. NPDC090106 TaxID=3365946 RepID=UPI00380824C4
MGTEPDQLSPPAETPRACPLRIPSAEGADREPSHVPSPPPFPSVPQAVAACREEILVVLSTPEALRRAIGTRPSARGEVRIRVLYDPAVLSDERVRREASAVGMSGAQLRTARGLFGDLIIVDHDYAYLRERDGGHWVALGGDSSFLKLLRALFDWFWVSAIGVAGTEPDATDDSRWAILRMLAQGEKDEAIARRLGISVRTCRRRIAEILDEVGAGSRFQAGFLAARRHDLRASD